MIIISKIMKKLDIRTAIKFQCMKCSNRCPKKRFKIGDKRRDLLAVCSKKGILIVERDFITCSDCTVA